MEFNNQKIEEVRTLIKNGQFLKALNMTEEFTPENLVNDIQLLFYQFTEWKKKNILNLDNEEITRNRIVYTLLEILSEIENQYSTKKEQYKAKYRSKIENEIKSRYIAIENLNEKSEPISFLNKLLNENQIGVENILKSISENKDESTIFKEIDTIVASMNKKNDNGELSKTVNQIKKEYSKDHLYFEKWLNSELEKEKELNKLKWELSQYKKKYKKLLSGSIIFSIIFGIYHYLGIDINVEIQEDYNFTEFESEIVDFDTVEIE